MRPVLPGDSKCSTLEAMGLERKNPGLESGHEVTGDPLAAPVRHVIQFDALYHAALAVVDFQGCSFSGARSNPNWIGIAYTCTSENRK